ncbi:hypothetical protein ACQUWM_14290 [Marinobacter sp. DUT-3]|uniref:hypothetical protein n=1 Tax=Marinobacter sp. DUT-3 TaxID=3412036 RepID=UPI003D162EE0
MERKSGKLLAAGLAFVLWGSWALVVNWQAGAQAATIAALIQGSTSFVVTLLMAAAVTWQVRRFRHPVCRVLAPPLITVSVTGSFLFLVHSLGQTPGLWQTILPPTTIAFCYCLLLSVQLQREASLSSTRLPVSDLNNDG